MYRRLLELVLVCTSLAQWGWAQEVRIWNRTVQAHGFVSQGFVYTNQNNWLTMNTTKGRGAMTEMGLNVSSQITDKFRVGAQVYDRNLGQLGQLHPALDWAVADYRFANWFGIRAGKVKTTLGLYNDSQDLGFLVSSPCCPKAFIPQTSATRASHTRVGICMATSRSLAILAIFPTRVMRGLAATASIAATPTSCRSGECSSEAWEDCNTEPICAGTHP